MGIGFYVYIDESGDEGFKFDQPGRGSSRWFVLSAVVTRAEHDRDAVRAVEKARLLLGRSPREALHFRNLKHEHRLPYIAKIVEARLRLVSVLIHKPNILEPEKFTSEPHLLYRYATRYLLERVSWLCRDHRRKSDDMARILFSNRSCMSYTDLRAYLQLLKDKTNDLDVRIDWSTFDPKDVEARTHDALMGLQIADATASAFYMACELTPQGFNEPRYANMLKSVVYSHEQQFIGYGLKFWPRGSPARVV